jgi:hypothetical protein
VWVRKVHYINQNKSSVNAGHAGAALFLFAPDAESLLILLQQQVYLLSSSSSKNLYLRVLIVAALPNMGSPAALYYLMSMYSKK